jgi:predicted GNAT superfamily acetyltransferase
VATGEATGMNQIGPSIIVRNCDGLEEMRACVKLQQEVWNFSDADLVPLRMFVVAEKIGGQVIGAFVRDELVGFAFSLPAIRTGYSYLHSHMLAVKQERRNTGLGRRIKLFQREDALRRGFELIEWTFDPLEIKNAYLNIEKLGAIARRYSVNQYGITSSPLQGGLPTDRLIAEWWLKSKRVNGILKDKAKTFQLERTVSVPAEIYEWKASSTTRQRAEELQQRNRQEFLAAFSEGLAVLGYKRDRKGNGKFLLGRWHDE